MDGGICEEGLESTIVRPLKGQLVILRKGSLSQEEIQQFLTTQNISYIVSYQKSDFVPGGQKSHYAPSAPLFIVESSSAKEAEIFLKEKFPSHSIKYLNLNSKPALAARSLYHDLRKLSKGQKIIICVQKTQENTGGLWDTIWDRLEKAATDQFKI